MPVAAPGLRWHETVDIGIVGAGGCGLVAAHAAAASDLRITVWEKANAPSGLTTVSDGLVPAAGTRFQRAAGIVDSPTSLADDIFARNGNRSDPALTRRLCDSSARLVEWLVDSRGIALELVPYAADSGHRLPRLHAPRSRRGRTLIDGLLRGLERRGVTVHCGTPVTQLWTDAEGAVLGVQVKRARKTPLNVRCSALILATDGFAGDRDLLLQHAPDAAGLQYVGAATSSGDALRWAADVGAATQHLGAYAVHATAALGSRVLIPTSVLAHGAILVNQRGTRFANETAGTAALVTAVNAQPGHLAYEIFGADTLAALATLEPRFVSDILPRTARRADDPEGLAKQFQIDPQTLLETVTAYNAAVAGGTDAFGRQALATPLTPPLYGIRVGAALLDTHGGLAIDACGRVLRPDGGTIPNLYAGGGAAVGLSGPDGDGYLLGNGLLCALGWGLVAGEHAAQAIRNARATMQPAPAGDDPSP